MRRIEVGGEGEGYRGLRAKIEELCLNASPRQPQRRLVQRRRLPRARPRRSEGASHRAHLARRAVAAVAALTRRTVPTLARKLDFTVDFSTLVTVIIFCGGLVMMITTTAWPLISPRMREARRRAGEPRPRFRDFGEDYDAYLEDLCGWLGIEGPGWLQEGLHGPIDPPPPAGRRRGRTPPRRRQHA